MLSLLIGAVFSLWNDDDAYGPVVHRRFGDRHPAGLERNAGTLPLSVSLTAEQ